MFEAYRIGIKLSLIDHVSSGLASIALNVSKTDAEFKALEGRIISIQNRATKGVMMMGGGMAMLGLLKSPYEEAKKLAQAQADFQTLNLSASDNSAVFAKAAALSHSVLGSTITQNIKNIQDLHTAFGDLHHAIAESEMFTKMSIVAKVANGGKDVDGIINAAAKALEHRGGKVLNNQAAFDSEGNMMTQVMLASKMRVSPKDFLSASGTGKMAYQMMDPEYLYGNFAGLMGINGGFKEGTAAMTAFSSLVGGHMDSKGKGFLSELGLWTEGISPKRLKLMQEATKGMSKEDMKNLGFLTPTSGGLSDADADLYMHRTDKFISERLVPAIRKRFGFDLTDEQIGAMIAKNFNRNTGDFLGTQVTMASKLSKDTVIFGNTMGIGAAYKHYMQSPEGAEEAAGAAWKNFLAVFGSVYLPAITGGLLKLAGALDSLGEWASKNQTLVAGLVYSFGLLGGALLIGGALNVVVAAFQGINLILGIGRTVGLVGALKGLGEVLGVGGGFAKAGLAGAAIFAAVEVGRLIAAFWELHNINNRGGVRLTENASDRLNDPETKDKLRAMDDDFVAKKSQTTPPVSVVLKADHRGFTAWMAGGLAKNQFGGLGSGTFDYSVAAPGMNNKG